MNLLAVSINHHTAPVELREALHLSREEITDYIGLLKKGLLEEGLIISTCNRTEIYGIPRDSKTTYTDLEKFLSANKPGFEITTDHFQKFFSCSAVNHLFKVTSGIDSLLIGDNQILGQAKEAFQISEENGFAGLLMKRVFDSAVKVGKRAKTETTISDGAITVSYAAVQLIEKIFSNLSKKSALVIGLGETGEIAAKHLRDKNIGRLALTNRTQTKAEKLAAQINAEVIPFERFKSGLSDFDIVISATSAPGFIIEAADIRIAMKKKGYAATVLMDIAVPRDIDPSVKNIDNVFYNDIDSLNIIVEQNVRKRKDEVPKVQNIILEELVSYYSWFNSLEVAPAIKLLRELFEEIRAEEVTKQINRFTEDDREKLEIVTKRIINKILHHPTIELRKIAEQGTLNGESIAKIETLKELFGLNKITGSGE
jgi:glutamyl-tRNA reductase